MTQMQLPPNDLTAPLVISTGFRGCEPEPESNGTCFSHSEIACSRIYSFPVVALGLNADTQQSLGLVPTGNAGRPRGDLSNTQLVKPNTVFNDCTLSFTSAKNFVSVEQQIALAGTINVATIQSF